LRNAETTTVLNGVRIDQPQPAPVPLPAGLTLGLTGFGLLALFRRKRAT